MVACLLMALAGYLTFGDKTVGNVLNNLPSDNTMVNVARLCFGLNMLTTLPLEAFVCREVMLNYWWPGAPFNMKLHLVLTTGLVVGAMVLSLLTCDLGTVFELVGATSAAAMAYILPPLCYIKLTTRSWKTYVAWVVVVFGCLVMGISVVQSVGKIIRGMFRLPFPLGGCVALLTRMVSRGGRHCRVHDVTILFFYLLSDCNIPRTACFRFWAWYHRLGLVRPCFCSSWEGGRREIQPGKEGASRRLQQACIDVYIGQAL